MKSTADIIFRARDLAAVKAYYAGELGFPLVLEREGMIGFETGALTLYFERGEPNGAVFEFGVDDPTRAKAELVAAGCELVEENPAIPRIYLRDRFGVVFNVNKA